jgi:hypothetical protein
MSEQQILEGFHQFNAAIDFAIDGAGPEGILFLSLWREGAWDVTAKEFPEFEGPLPTR